MAGNHPRRMVPVTAVVATAERAASLRRMLDSMLSQEVLPAEIVVVDASEGETTWQVCVQMEQAAPWNIAWERATDRGAAVQRNAGVAHSSQAYVLFCDDDVLFQPGCLGRLVDAMDTHPRAGGVTTTITNQRYAPPGAFSRLVYRLLGASAGSLAGRVIGPAVNFLPEDRDGLPEVVPVQWMNTTCTLYRREALPAPPFPSHFHGYSLCEDLTLSLLVGREWELYHVRKAHIIHESQPGSHKSNPRRLARMEVVNRHFVMTTVLGKRGALDWVRFVAWEVFNSIAVVRLSDRKIRALLDEFLGKLQGFSELLRAGRQTP